MKSSLKLPPTTVIGKQQEKKLNLIINFLFDSIDAADFRQPVDWQGLQILDYPSIVKHPMDLGTVKIKMGSKAYSTVQELLDDIQLIWDNCKAYNKSGYFYDLADKMERSFKKMVKNYLPNINIIIPSKSHPIQNLPQSQNIQNEKQKEPPKNQKLHKDISQNNLQQNKMPTRDLPSRNSKSRNSANNQQNHIQISQLHEQPQIDQIPQSQKIKFHQRLKKITQEELAKIVSIIQQNCMDAWKQIQKGRCQIILDDLDLQTFKRLNEKLDEFLEIEDKVTKKIKTS